MKKILLLATVAASSLVLASCGQSYSVKDFANDSNLVQSVATQCMSGKLKIDSEACKGLEQYEHTAMNCALGNAPDKELCDKIKQQHITAFKTTLK